MARTRRERRERRRNRRTTRMAGEVYSQGDGNLNASANANLSDQIADELTTPKDQEGVSYQYTPDKFQHETRFADKKYDGLNQFYSIDPGAKENKRERRERGIRNMMSDPSAPQEYKDEVIKRGEAVAFDLNKYGGAGFGMKDIEGFRAEGKSDEEILREMDAVRREGIDNVGFNAYSTLQRDKLGEYDSTQYGGAGIGRKDIYEFERQGMSPKQIAGVVSSFQQQGDVNVGAKAKQYAQDFKNYKSENYAITNPRTAVVGKQKRYNKDEEGNNVINYRVGKRLKNNAELYGLTQQTYADLADQTGIKFQEVERGQGSADIKHTFGNVSSILKNADGTPLDFTGTPQAKFTGLHVGPTAQTTNPDGTKKFSPVTYGDFDDQGNFTGETLASSELFQKGFKDTPGATDAETQDYRQNAINRNYAFNKDNTSRTPQKHSAANTEDRNNMYKNVLTHEIGHALGMGENRTKMRDEQGNYITKEIDGQTKYLYGDYHNPSYSVMSYEHNTNRGSGFTEHDVDQLYQLGYKIKPYGA